MRDISREARYSGWDGASKRGGEIDRERERDDSDGKSAERQQWMDGWNREQVRKEEDGNGII